MYRIVLGIVLLAFIISLNVVRAQHGWEHSDLLELAQSVQSNPERECRALWVTRYDYKEPEDVDQILINCASYHFNLVFFQVRGNATTFYPSRYEPWAWELTGEDPSTLGTDPGWDPLARAVEKAHQLGLQLHAYINIFPAWKQPTPPPTEAQQLWNTHREWFMCDKEGEVMWPHDWWDYWYAFIDPCVPEVQDHLNKVFVEVMTNYDIDGVHYDYVRYPSEVGDYSYHPVSMERFQAKYGGTPDELPEEWKQWKRDHVTLFAKRTHEAAARLRPNLITSASVIGDYVRAYDRYFQDGRGWLREGILDITMPMIYTDDIEVFGERARDHIENSYGRYSLPGIGAGRTDEKGLVMQIQLSRALGAPGVIIFAYSSLFRGHAPNKKAEALLKGPFSNVAAVPPLLWKHVRDRHWQLY